MGQNSSKMFYSGTEFNRKYAGKTFVKLTNERENHNGFQFRDGLNVDSLQFNPHGECRPGGIYFCLETELPRWLHYNEKTMVYCREVTIPNHAKVYDEGDKFKADRLIL